MNLMQVFESTNRGKKVKTRLERESKTAEKKLRAAEQNLKKEEESLKKEVALLSGQAKSQKIFMFQEKVSKLQREAKEKDMELQKLQGRLMEPILEQMKVVTGNVAKKGKYQIVKNIGPDTIWVAPELDITKQVIKAYNKKYK